MSLSTNTVCKSHNARSRWLAALVSALCLVAASDAQVGELRVPSRVVAGTSISIPTTGSGTGTFYLVGPSAVTRRDVDLGQQISVPSEDLRSAGRYVGILCADTCGSVAFFVMPAKPVSLTFLVHPSRAPVGQNDVISGVALPFDEFRNQVVAPVTVNFQLTAGSSSPMSHSVSSQNGIAWFRANSGKSAGALQVVASLGDASARRIVQQVASDPCNLRIKGQRTAKGIMLETEPVRDCAGNPVPDGTVVTFTAKDGKEASTVDAPIKQGIARAHMTAAGPVSISAASGVVMGNELHLGAQ
jgi:hypothetical protein